MNVVIWMAAAVSALGVLTGAPSWAQDYPAKPVRLIVPFPPGGTPDTLARLVGEKLGDRWNQQVLVETRLGAGGNVAYGSVAGAAPDGYTILLAATGIATNVSLYSKLPYDPVRDFAAITLLATSPHVLVASSSVPAANVRELVALAKARPGTLTYGSSGSGTVLHLAGELFKTLSGADIIHVPYKGSQPAMTDLLGGRISLMYVDFHPALPHIRSGKLKPLGLTGRRRSPLLPDVPTIAEAGVPGYEIVAWFGLLAPAATPGDVVDRIHQGVVQVLELPDLRSRLTDQGMELVGSTPASFAAYLRSEIVAMAKVVKASGAKAD